MGRWKNTSPDDAFDEKVHVEPNSGCWLWAGSTRDGYGRFLHDGRFVQAHRWSYERVIGAVPEGLQLDHLCRTRCCVNPAHLEPVTLEENVRRGLVGEHNRRKTACPQGHAYADDNLRRRPSGHRRCRECDNSRSREYQRRKRAA